MASERPDHRAHLTGIGAPTPPIHRYQPSAPLTDLIRSFWIPVWDLPDDTPQIQRVLQYPVCLIVVASEYARFYGVVPGLSTVELSGRGWAAGVMLQPAAGRLLWGASIASMTGRHVPLDHLDTVDGAALEAEVRRLMEGSPGEPTAHNAVAAAYEAALAPLLPIDEEGRLVNSIVELVESDTAILRVEELAERVGLTERTLQRITRERLGLTPKWLIQRRRLHDAVSRLKAGTVSLAELALELGYTDQAHFTRDFRRATGTTPGAYLSDQPG